MSFFVNAPPARQAQETDRNKGQRSVWNLSAANYLSSIRPPSVAVATVLPALSC